MSRDSRPRVVRLDSSRSASRPRPLDATVLTHIITTQDEVGRAGLDPLKVVDVITRRAQELTRSSGAVVEMVDGTDMFYWSASGVAATQKGLRIPIENSLSGSSVIARLNLRGMPELIKVLSGRTETVSELDALRARIGDDPKSWLPIFMGRD